VNSHTKQKATKNNEEIGRLEQVNHLLNGDSETEDRRAIVGAPKLSCVIEATDSGTDPVCRLPIERESSY
jgi:hypothetical protein